MVARKDEVRQWRVQLVKDFLRDVIGEGYVHGHGLRHHAGHIAPLRGRAETGVDSNRPSASQLPERPGVEVRLVSEQGGEIGDFAPCEREFGGTYLAKAFPVP